MYDSVVRYLVDLLGVEDFIRLKSVFIFLIGMLTAALITTYTFSNTFMKVKKLDSMKRVTFLVLEDEKTGNKEYFASEPNTRLEAMQTMFFMWLHKVHFPIFGNRTIRIHTCWKAYFVFYLMMSVALIMLAIGLYMSIHLVYDLSFAEKH